MDIFFKSNLNWSPNNIKIDAWTLTSIKKKKTVAFSKKANVYFKHMPH